MSKIPDSDLIVNPNGSIYHLDLLPDELAHKIIVVGDPDRVALVSKNFDNIEVKKQKREFVSHTGMYNGKRITAMSTGIGTDNIDIVFNELDALVNINLKTKKARKRTVSLEIVRIGTAGGLQKDVPVDSFVFSTHGVGLDGLLNFYKLKNTPKEKKMLAAFCKHYPTKGILARPYIVQCDNDLKKRIGIGMIQGMTATCNGFYGPQGRELRYKLARPDFIKKMNTFQFQDHKIANFEMETSAMYGLGRVLNHKVATVTAIVANRISLTVTKGYQKPIENLIKLVLDRI